MHSLLGLKNDKFLISKTNGDLIIENSIKANNIQFNFKGQNIKVDGEFRNLAEWLSGKSVKMTAKANVAFDKLTPEAFFATNNIPGIQITAKKQFRCLEILFWI